MKQTILIFLITSFFFSCQKEKSLFELLPSDKTGISFINTITEGDTMNILDTEYIYNGGGVAVGDLNGDGLQDLYFTGNQVGNKLYLNKGDLKFEDITAQSGADKNGKQWCSGVNILDINQDGMQDIYICNTLYTDTLMLKNFLFVNQGNDKNGVPKFKEMAKEYGIDDANHHTNAQFFDYDNDGDLDIFIGINIINTKYPNQFFEKNGDGSDRNRDVLLQNTWDETLKHPVFKDVSVKAGIVWTGYSHSTMITDFNEDGWMDIYVANDYLSNDLIYINNKNGTFTNKIADIFKHQSSSAMGSDVADINNDGLLDLFTTEMLPYTNKRKKLFLSGNNYAGYVFNEQYHYEYQYARNTLQLNRGLNPQSGLPVFSDIAFMANVQETDWSWTPLIADFDNDGFKDILVTNGFPKDVIDHDFGAFRNENNNLVSKETLLAAIPVIKSPNFIFKNNGDLTFEDVTHKWGVELPSFTNGAAYADLDNDGDLEIITNNINDKAFVFKNNLIENSSAEVKKNHNFIRIKAIGDVKNKDSFGAEIQIFYEGKQQIAQITSARGYLSKSENTVHFGLGNATKVDSVIVKWKNDRKLRIIHPAINQTIEANINLAKINNLTKAESPKPFEAIDGKALGLDYTQQETDFVDFNFQRTLPHKFSQAGPNLTIGDVNNDGLDDVFFGGSAGFDASIYLQNANGKFTIKQVNLKSSKDKKEEDLGSLLFDADNDGDNDLYIVRGSYQYPDGSSNYQHLLCINDGKGNFKIDSTSINHLKTCGSAVKAVDFDGDGDLDLFVGGRVKARAYPQTDKSFVLRNDSQGKDHPKFTDITQQICPELANIGMVSDALWTDFNNDNKPDLIIAGEWMPLTFFQNEHGKLVNVTATTGISEKLGWWTSLTGADFDNDGDIDYVAGNYGLNNYFKCKSEEPITMYAKDFDNNGNYDAFISCFLRDSTDTKHEYFYHTRDDMVKQLVLIRRKFQTYGDFGKATVTDVFTKEELKDAQILKTNWMSSSYIENLGNGKFQISALPVQAQMAPLYGLLPYDYDKDGLLDLLAVGNDFGMELLQGRADAFYGLVLKNNGKGGFASVELNRSHFYVPGDAKALGKIAVGNQELILATQNRNTLKIINPQQQATKIIRLSKEEAKAIILLKNGKKRSTELYWGSTYLSQDSRTFAFDNTMKEVILYKDKNQVSRKIQQ